MQVREREKTSLKELEGCEISKLRYCDRGLDARPLISGGRSAAAKSQTS